MKGLLSINLDALGEVPGSPVNSSVVQLAVASELTQIVKLPRCLSEALYLLQLRMRNVDFFFMAEKAYHITSSATLHSDSCNKALNGLKSATEQIAVNEDYQPGQEGIPYVFIEVGSAFSFD